VRVEAADAPRVARQGGAVHEVERRGLVIVFADDGPERRRSQRDVPPFLADVRGGACPRRVGIGRDAWNSE